MLIPGGSVGGYSLSAASMGVSGGNAAFWIDSPIESIQGANVVQSIAQDGSEYRLLPYSENAEAVTIGAKWSVAKAGRVKIVKDRATKTSSLVATGAGNMSGLKLSYQAKTGVFKGSFTAYTVVNSKLKKHKFAVTGVAVGGTGTGIAVCKKAGVAVGVTVGDPARCDGCSAQISE